MNDAELPCPEGLDEEQWDREINAFKYHADKNENQKTASVARHVLDAIRDRVNTDEWSARLLQQEKETTQAIEGWADAIQGWANALQRQAEALRKTNGLREARRTVADPDATDAITETFNRKSDQIGCPITIPGPNNKAPDQRPRENDPLESIASKMLNALEATEAYYHNTGTANLEDLGWNAVRETPAYFTARLRREAITGARAFEAERGGALAGKGGPASPNANQSVS